MPASMKHVVSVPWTDQERDTLLRQMWANGIGCTGIGRHLGRSKYSVRSEIETLNLGPRGSLVAPPAQPPPPEPLPATTATTAATRRPRTLPPLPRVN